MNRLHYFILKGYESIHDGDEWIGIYSDLNTAKEAYFGSIRALEKEYKVDSEKPNEQRIHNMIHEKVMINIYDENTDSWSYNVDSNELFR